MKKIFIFLIFLSIILLNSCQNNNQTTEENNIKTQESSITNNKNTKTNNILNSYMTSDYVLHWDKIDEASKYGIYYGENEVFTTDTSYDFFDILTPDKKYIFTIYAYDNNTIIDEQYNDVEIIFESYKNLTYNLTTDGLGYSINYKNKDFDNLPECLILPDEYNDLPIVEIEEFGFSILQSLNGTIYYNKTVKRVRLSKYLECINFYSFSYYSKLEKIVFPKENVSIYRSFMYCGLKEINIPSNCSINNSFTQNLNLESIYINDGVEVIKDSFIPCTNIKYLYLPDTLKILSGFFEYPFEEIEFPSNLEEIGGFARSNLKRIEIPNSVKKIDDLAFYNSLNLESINYGENLKDVGYGVFRNTKWSNDKKDFIIINGTLVDYINDSNSEIIEIPSSVKKIAYSVFENNTYIKKIIFDRNIEIVNLEYMFRNCTNLEYIDISKLNITELSKDMFYNCVNLKEIILPDGLTSISSSFTKCINLTNVDLKKFKKLNYIDAGAFFGSGIKSIYISKDIGINYSDVLIINGVNNLEYVILDKEAKCMPVIYLNSDLDIFYEGSMADYINNGYNTNISNDYYLDYTYKYVIWYYSDTKPSEEGNYWHYVDGEITKW